MKISSSLCSIVLATFLVLVTQYANVAGKPVRPPLKGYEHMKFAPAADILRIFDGFAVSFDSKDDDDGDSKSDLLRVPHWVAHELRRWEPPEAERGDLGAWCLNTLKKRPSWFTDPELYKSGVAPKDASYRGSGFDRGHMAMKLLIERLGQDAAYNTHTLLNAVPQRPKFNRGIWKDLEDLTGAWAQAYERLWVIQGPVFYPGKIVSWIGDKGERKIAIPDAIFKIVVREKNDDEKRAASKRNKNTPEVLAFLYPQIGPGYFGLRADYRHERFITTIDEIEKLTGLNFPIFEDFEIEKIAKRRLVRMLWKIPDKANAERRKTFITGCRR